MPTSAHKVCTNLHNNIALTRIQLVMAIFKLIGSGTVANFIPCRFPLCCGQRVDEQEILNFVKASNKMLIQLSILNN